MFSTRIKSSLVIVTKDQRKTKRQRLKDKDEKTEVG